MPRYYRTPPSGDRVAKPGLGFLKAQVEKPRSSTGKPDRDEAGKSHATHSK
jgi:hypothetical protein